jgi:hypothetical protein
MCAQVCVFRWSLLENSQPHTSQANCFSPACINTCKFSAPLAKNIQLYISYLKGFFPVWVIMWYSRCANCWNHFPHMNKNVFLKDWTQCKYFTAAITIERLHTCASMDMSLVVWSQRIPFTTYYVTTDSISFFVPLDTSHFVRTPHICDMNPHAFLPEVLDTRYHFHIFFWLVLKQCSLQNKINTKALAENLVSWIGASCFT